MEEVSNPLEEISANIMEDMSSCVKAELASGIINYYLSFHYLYCFILPTFIKLLFDLFHVSSSQNSDRKNSDIIISI